MPEEYSHITDNELRELLKKRMLEADASDPLAEQLLEQEAMLAFGSDAVFVPSAEKEKQLLKAEKSPVFRFKKWLLPAIIAVVGLAAFFTYKKAITKKEPDKKATQETSIVTQKEKANEAFIPPKALVEELITHTASAVLNKAPEGKVQLIKTILKENADCAHAIYVTDSIVFSPHSPRGVGNELEIKNNVPDDPKYFENEHNTVWYKYVVPEDGQLTFDIIPVDQDNDYDFMLYKWDGGDFRAKVLSKKIEPVRSCISRNDKKLQSMTGLWIDSQLPSYIHSGEGASYVRYIDVSEKDVFYLLVDNVYPNGNGHTVKFHLKPFVPGELHIGQEITFSKITFKDSDDEFRKGSEKDLDSLYRFLVYYPTVKIEVQGHCNQTGDNNPIRQPGKPAYNVFELSQRRAVVIVEYLVKRGIDPVRLVPRGYGSSKKKIENPKTIKENIMNVRAEIKILSLDYRQETGPSGMIAK